MKKKFAINEIVRAGKVPSIPLRYQGRCGIVIKTKRYSRGVRYAVGFPQRTGLLLIAHKHLKSASF